MKISTLRTLVTAVLIIFGIVSLFIFAYKFFLKSEDTEKEPGTMQLASDPDSTIFISEDSGRTWRGVKDTNLRVERLVFDPNSLDLYVGTQRDGLWVSEGSRGAFTQILDSTEQVDEHARILDIVPAGSGDFRHYIAASYGGKGRLLSLVDAAYRELYFTPISQTFVFDVDIDPIDPQHLLLISGDGGFIESRDSGETWRSVYRFQNAAKRLVVHPDIPGKLWVVSIQGEVYASFDYGVTWTDVSAGLEKYPRAREIENLYLDAGQNLLYLTSGYGLLRSQDDGITWEPVNLIVPPASMPIIAFAVDPADSRVIYISAGSQLYKSTDGGMTWQGIDFKGRRAIRSIAIDPTSPNRVFIGLDR